MGHHLGTTCSNAKCQMNIPASPQTLKEVLSHLRRTHFEAAALDLLYGECSLALAHEMGVPAVGFWGSSPVSGQGANSNEISI